MSEDEKKVEAPKTAKVAEAGKEQKKPISKVDVKKMSKLEAQKIINEKGIDIIAIEGNIFELFI